MRDVNCNFKVLYMLKGKKNLASKGLQKRDTMYKVISNNVKKKPNIRISTVFDDSSRTRTDPLTIEYLFNLSYLREKYEG